MDILHLGLFLAKNGQYGTAESTLAHTLEMRKANSGPEDPGTLICMNNLAIYLAGQGKFEAAENLFLETLEAKKRILGPDHTSTLGSGENWALALRDRASIKQQREHIGSFWRGETVSGASQIPTLWNVLTALAGYSRIKGNMTWRQQCISNRWI